VTELPVNDTLGLTALLKQETQKGNTMSNAVTIELATGRVVTLERLIIEDIYTGVTAGSPEELRQILIDIPLERVQTLDDEDAPFFMIEPPEGKMPRLAVVVELNSDKPVADGDEGDWSDLNVCWFIDEFPTDIIAHVSAMVRDIDWELNAANFAW
jgi:hypothetical protein